MILDEELDVAETLAVEDSEGVPLVEAEPDFVAVPDLLGLAAAATEIVCDGELLIEDDADPLGVPEGVSDIDGENVRDVL